MARRKKAMDFSSLDLNLDALGDWGGDEEKAEKEFIRAAKLNLSPVTWDNAEAAADAVDYDKDYFALLSGRFIFGDFIEALIYKKELLPHRVYITTLGMSRENIDSIVNIAGYLGCEHLNLIVSNYFVAMERAKLVPYMISQFTGQHINVAVLASHLQDLPDRERQGKSDHHGQREPVQFQQCGADYAVSRRQAFPQDQNAAERHHEKVLHLARIQRQNDF